MGSFEDRLLALSNAATLKKAKALLKQQNLIGAWRQPDGRLHGISGKRTIQLPKSR